MVTTTRGQEKKREGQEVPNRRIAKRTRQNDSDDERPNDDEEAYFPENKDIVVVGDDTVEEVGNELGIDPEEEQGIPQENLAGINQDEEALVMTTSDYDAAKRLIMDALGSARSSSRKECDVKLVNTVWKDDCDLALCYVQNGRVDCLQGTCHLKNTDFLQLAFDSASSTSSARLLWAMLPNKVKRVASVACAAYRRSAICFTELSKSLLENKDTILNALLRNDICWSKLPISRKRDVEYALAAKEHIRFCDVVQVVDDQQRLWTEWAIKFPCAISPRVWQFWAPSSIISDKKIMMDVICRDPSKVSCLDHSLATDSDFVHKVLETDIMTLPYFTGATHEAIPGIFSMETIREYLGRRDSDRTSLVQSVPSCHWMDREFVLGWIHAGLELRFLSSSLRQEKEIFLEYARSNDLRRNCIQDYSEYSRVPYSLMSKSLKRDKEFIECLLESGATPSRLMRAVSRRFQSDEYLQVLAASKDRNYHPPSTPDIPSLEAKMTRQKREYEAFFQGFLLGTSHGSGSQLTRLADTNVTRMIASYLDFPVGKQLSCLLRAVQLREDV